MVHFQIIHSSNASKLQSFKPYMSNYVLFRNDSCHFLYFLCPGLNSKSTLTPGLSKNIKNRNFTRILAVALNSTLYIIFINIKYNSLSPWVSYNYLHNN